MKTIRRAHIVVRGKWAYRMNTLPNYITIINIRKNE